MPFTLRHVPWFAQLILLSAFAWLVARTGNVFVEDALVTPPPWTPPPGAPMPPTPGPGLDGAVLARVFGLPAPKVSTSEALADATELRRSALPLRLLGTLVSEAKPDWSVASLQDTTTRRTTTHMTGDVLSIGVTLVAIERHRVIVLNGTRREFIDGAVDPSPRAQVASGVRQLDGNTFELARVELDRHLANLSEVALQARIVPAKKGFKVFSIRPDSVYAQLGVADGDLIQRINGSELDSPERLLELYTKLRTTGRIDVELERNGSVVRRSYVIK